ncbi:hypothetical protein HPB50_017726 [Hyalomma asiaticum]|uniref:Uncharacterized protein n=1 Tax=Hyalomma asiaticum TaxID=266040 RepID=A0ACB7SZQ0_HYAAI|nr:hypothetical protein HPB50_017726 [Hyalomma asiaticum]
MAAVRHSTPSGQQVDGGRPPEQQTLLDEVSEALLRECRRDNRVYQEQAVRHLARLLEAQQLDRFGPLLDILEGPLLKYAASRSGNSEGAVDQDEDDEGAWDLESQLQFQEASFEALGQAWPQQAPATQARLCDLLLSSFSSGGTWKVQLAIIKALHLFVLRLSWPAQAPAEEVASMANGIVQVACEALEMTKYSSLCLEALKLLKTFVERIQGTQTSWIVGPSFEKLQCAVSTMATRDNVELRNLAQEVADIMAAFT